MNILAIDLGTQSIRAAIVNTSGDILSVSQEQQEVDNPHTGWAQQKPIMWWELTKRSIKDVIRKSKIEVKTIKGICACGQMHGPVGIDENGEITTEWTQIWMDKRCEDICRIIKKDSKESKLANITGNPVTTGWVGLKVRWIKENQLEIYNNSEWFLVPKDFINYKLTGIAATDPSEASGTYLYDFSTNKYSGYMAKILDINLKKFAPIKKSYDIVGIIKANIAEELGIPSNIPVIAGGGDFIVSLLGLGMVGKEIAVDMTGTSTLLVVKKDKPIIHPAVQNLKHVLEGWVPFTMLDCGGLAIKWCKDLLNSIRSDNITYDQMIKLAGETPIGSEGLLFYPYLLGERREDNVFAKGCFYGLRVHHKAKHIARSVMEGVALALGKDMQLFKNLGVNIKQIYCVGGATRNKLLYQIKANVMDIPHILTDEPEASLRGCGLLASYGLGYMKDIKKTVIMDNQENNIILPEKEFTQKYEKLQTDFNKMYYHLIGYWN